MGGVDSVEPFHFEVQIPRKNQAAVSAAILARHYNCSVLRPVTYCTELEVPEKEQVNQQKLSCCGNFSDCSYQRSCPTDGKAEWRRKTRQI